MTVENPRYDEKVPFIFGPKHGQVLHINDLKDGVFEGYDAMTVDQDHGEGHVIYTVMVYDNSSEPSLLMV